MTSLRALPICCKAKSYLFSMIMHGQGRIYVWNKFFCHYSFRSCNSSKNNAKILYFKMNFRHLSIYVWMIPVHGNRLWQKTNNSEIQHRILTMFLAVTGWQYLWKSSLNKFYEKLAYRLKEVLKFSMKHIILTKYVSSIYL